MTKTVRYQASVPGGRTKAQIERLMVCARARGFVLPAPEETRPGEFVFDLNAGVAAVSYAAEAGA